VEGGRFHPMAECPRCEGEGTVEKVPKYDD